MDRNKMAQTMEEVVRSFREQLAQNDESTWSNLGNSAKLGMESLKAKMMGTDEDEHVIDMFNRYADNFKDALENRDRLAASRALDDMQKTIQGFRIQSYDTV